MSRLRVWANELPMGLMVWHAGLHDDDVLHISQHIETTLSQG